MAGDSAAEARSMAVVLRREAKYTEQVCAVSASFMRRAARMLDLLADERTAQ